MHMDISVVIPTLNGKHLLEKNLPFLFDALEYAQKNCEIIIVDNNSHDNTDVYIEKLKNTKLHLRGDRITERPPRRCIINGLKKGTLQYVRFQKNRGFTGAVNEGVRKAAGKYILMLNNDCRLEKDTVKKMVDALEKHTEWVATQPVINKLRIKEQEKEIENIGYEVDLYRGKARPIQKTKSIKYKACLPAGRVLSIKKDIFRKRYLYGLSAACLLIRRDVFMKIGMFDEAFHSYLEDVDLFIRLAKNGYQYYPTLSAECLHDHMATSSRMGNYKEKQDVKNWARIIAKNYPASFTIWHFFPLFVERLRNISGLVKKSVRMIL